VLELCGELRKAMDRVDWNMGETETEGDAMEHRFKANAPDDNRTEAELLEAIRTARDDEREALEMKLTRIRWQRADASDRKAI
jgi:hypothetical protein